MDQLIIILLVVAFTVGDLFLRWAKKRRGGGQVPPPRRDEPDTFEDGEEVDVPDWFEQLRRQQEAQRREEGLERQRRQQAPSSRAPEPQRNPARASGPSARRAEPAAPRRIPAQLPFPSEGPKPRLAPTPAEAALAAKMNQSAVGRPPRVGVRGVFSVRQWIQTPQDVRKGIILMNVLGPPRGLD